MIGAIESAGLELLDRLIEAQEQVAKDAIKKMQTPGEGYFPRTPRVNKEHLMDSIVMEHSGPSDIEILVLSEYAEYVHENERTGKTQGVGPPPYYMKYEDDLWSRVGEYKFLEKSLVDLAKTYAKDIAEKAK